jgi:hypothetical protein
MTINRAARRGGALLGGMLTLGLLAGCTPGTPQDYGVRLNSDGTIDFVDCNGLTGDVVVRFAVAEGMLYEDAPVLWEVDRTGLGRLYEVVQYGTTPNGSTTVTLEPPPSDWLWVGFGGDDWYSSFIESRSDLVEDEWVWRNDEFWSFVPEHACAEVD